MIVLYILSVLYIPCNGATSDGMLCRLLLKGSLVDLVEYSTPVRVL